MTLELGHLSTEWWDKIFPQIWRSYDRSKTFSDPNINITNIYWSYDAICIYIISFIKQFALVSKKISYKMRA